MSLSFYKQRHCSICADVTQQQLGRVVGCNNVSHVGWYCCKGLHWSPRVDCGQWLSLQELELLGLQLEEVQILEEKPKSVCEVCQELGAELHHWAPRALFGELCSLWPKSWLCRRCHELWHNKVTPQIFSSISPTATSALLLAFLLLCAPASRQACAQGTYVPFKATQTEVNSGVAMQKYVSPDTLYGWGTNYVAYGVGTNRYLVGFVYGSGIRTNYVYAASMSYPVIVTTNGVLISPL